MINPEHLADAVRVAEAQPYPTQPILRERGVLVEARSGDIACEYLIPWLSFTDAIGPAQASAGAFEFVRKAMKTAGAKATR